MNSAAWLLLACLSIQFCQLIDADFFSEFGLDQSYLDGIDLKKLKRSYIKCVNKYNAIDKVSKESDVPEQIDIDDLRDDNYRNFDVNGLPNKAQSVKLWPNNRVPTVIDNSIMKNEDTMKRLACAVSYFHSETCVRFVKRKPNDTDYLFITDNGIFCMSDSVGKKGGKQTVTLASDCWKHGTIVHELMHAIGHFHEHQRNDRDQHVKVFINKIPPIPTSYRHQFKKIKKLGYLHYKDIGVYDFSSIMHYGPKIGKDVVLSAKIDKYGYDAFLLNDAMGNRRRPTGNDTIKINLRYSCQTAVTTTTVAPTTTIVRAGPTKILLIGGFYYKSSMEIYNPGSAKRNRLIKAKLLKPRKDHTSFLLNDQTVLTAGGLDGTWTDGDYLADCEIFNPVTNKVSSANSMIDYRAFAGGAVLAGIPYICGGADASQLLSSCEIYQSGVWKYIASMKTARYALTMAATNQHLYAIGGVKFAGDKDVDLKIVERYNPSTDNWSNVKSMRTARAGPSAAVLRGLIYVCGGDRNEQELSTCEKYNPKTSKWSSIRKMHFVRSRLNLVAAGDQLYAFGGNGASSTVEMYDPKKRNWIKLDDLIQSRWRSTAVVLK